MSIGIRKTFNLDMVPGGAPPIIHVSAEDVGRPYRANLLYSGETYDLEDVTSVKIRGTKPDKTVFGYDLTFDDEASHVDFDIKEQMAIIAGQVLCEIRLFSGEDTIGSANFILDVETAVYDPEAASESYIPSFEAAIEEAVEAVNEAADRAEEAADSIMVNDYDRTPYKLRPSGGGMEIGKREYDTIVGGTVAWNQISNISDSTKTERDITISTSGNSISYGGTTSAGSTNYIQANVPFASPSSFISGHKYLFLISDTGATTDRRLYVVVNNPYTEVPQTGRMSYIFVPTSTPSYCIIRLNIGTESGVSVSGTAHINIVDLTQMFGSTIADYIYALEQATAGAGVAWFRQFFPNDYYEYNAGELLSVSGVSAHVMRNADENVIGNYPLDDSLTLRGIPKLDGSKLYYDGDTYEADGTVTRKYGVRAYQSGDESLADAITDGTNTVYKLTTPTTEIADPFTNPQVVDPDGTEQYVTTSIVPVGHDTRYPYNIANKVNQILDAPTTDGTYTLTVTVSNGVATYSWTSS